MIKTTNYEISKKLKEAGFEADADYYWVESKEGIICVNAYVFSDYMSEGKKLCEAFDLETLINALPKKLANKYGKKHALKLSYDTKLNCIYYSDEKDITFRFDDGERYEVESQENESLADIAGKMWLMLKEKGIIC